MSPRRPGPLRRAGAPLGGPQRPPARGRGRGRPPTRASPVGVPRRPQVRTAGMELGGHKPASFLLRAGF